VCLTLKPLNSIFSRPLMDCMALVMVCLICTSPFVSYVELKASFKSIANCAVFLALSLVVDFIALRIDVRRAIDSGGDLLGEVSLV
jgi:hypothetical protein